MLEPSMPKTTAKSLEKSDMRFGAPVFSQDDARFAAIATRDIRADGQFVYSVRTTGIYCRPSCGARLPLRENVAFHASCDAAERAGFRPCLRCKPRGALAADKRAQNIARACRLIETAEPSPSIAKLAASAGLSKFHFLREFKNVTGLTPKAYIAARRGQKMRDELATGSRVTDAIYASGFQSSSRFYAAADNALGMAPKIFREGAQGETIRFAISPCSLGKVLVAATQKGVCAILLGDSAKVLSADLARRFPKATLIDGDEPFTKLVGNVVALIDNPKQKNALPLDIRGTAFQQRVWQALRRIPAGQTVTYAELAEKIGAPKASRAVAGACAANAIAVAIPCHRVIRGDGSLSGYRWGVSRKEALLTRESGNAKLSKKKQK